MHLGVIAQSRGYGPGKLNRYETFRFSPIPRWSFPCAYFPCKKCGETFKRKCRCGQLLNSHFSVKIQAAPDTASAATSRPDSFQSAGPSDQRKQSEDRWLRFSKAPQEFLDVRAVKTKATSPDFKSRWARNRPPVALWLNDRFLPVYVKPLLQQLEAAGKAVYLCPSLEALL